MSSPKHKAEILHANSLASIPWLLHGFSTRSGGFSKAYGGHALNLGFTEHDSRAAVERNRAAFRAMLGAQDGKKPWPLATMRQIHSDRIRYIAVEPETPLFADGMITDTPGVLLAVQTADCLPVVLVDPKKRAVGVFHAGWRGTIKRIVQKGVGAMRYSFGTRSRDIRAAIGPGIHSCCYEVGAEVRAQFESQFEHAGKLFREVKDSDPIREKYPLLFLTARAPGHSESKFPRKIFLDLVEANRTQLLELGVSAKNIFVSPLCTACRKDILFSYRAENARTGRLMGVAGIRPE
jgi:YfiH family protein